jgi:hypothetical protein
MSETLTAQPSSLTASGGLRERLRNWADILEEDAENTRFAKQLDGGDASQNYAKVPSSQLDVDSIDDIVAMMREADAALAAAPRMAGAEDEQYRIVAAELADALAREADALDGMEKLRDAWRAESAAKPVGRSSNVELVRSGEATALNDCARRLDTLLATLKEKGTGR